jgi:hypothetical protein
MRLRKAGAGDEPCKTGIEIFPRFGTPFLVYGLPVIAGLMGLTALATIFLTRPAGVAPSSASEADGTG